MPLQRKATALDVVIDSLCALPQYEATELFHTLRRDGKEQLDRVIQTIRASSAQNLRMLDTWFPKSTTTLGAAFHVRAPQTEVESVRIPTGTDWAPYDEQMIRMEGLTSWFCIPVDPSFLNSLLDLYFLYSHTTYCFFSKAHFLTDMSRGSGKYCSTILVHAVLSVACQYSDQSSAREIAGDYFFSEAKRLAEEENAAELTSVQAMAVMAVREAFAGRDIISHRLCGRAVRLAFELGLHVSPSNPGKPKAWTDETRGQRLTFWGVFNLEIAGCLALGTVSSIPTDAIENEKRKSSSEKHGVSI